MNSNTVHLEELPYQPDSCSLFECIRELPGALLLDSAYPHSQAGRFDILTACIEESNPFSSSLTDTYDSIDKYFIDLKDMHNEHCQGLVPVAEDIPFCGGIAGYLDYELGNPLQRLPANPPGVGQLHFYHWAVIQDHLLQRCTFAALPSLASAQRTDLLERLRKPRRQREDATFKLRRPFQSNLDREQYRHALQVIQRYIRAGDCYQVNLAQRFSSEFEGDPWHAYCLLRPLAGAPFSGFMQLGADQHLLCLSPERFLRLSGHHVETRPIKGTRPRHRDLAADKLAAEELRRSTKDRAENLMIVDLLRNDIGRNCVSGSIRVDRLFELESFPTVHHLVSTISGELLPDRGAFELLRDSFPGGSITGAPKRRAMEVIAELEPHPRGAYCGSMLYISADGRMDSNIAIRSLACQQQQIHCRGGGGIVADSDWELEYQETWDKVGRFISALEQTL